MYQPPSTSLKLQFSQYPVHKTKLSNATQQPSIEGNYQHHSAAKWRLLGTKVILTVCILYIYMYICAYILYVLISYAICLLRFIKFATVKRKKREATFNIQHSGSFFACQLRGEHDNTQFSSSLLIQYAVA